MIKRIDVDGPECSVVHMVSFLRLGYLTFRGEATCPWGLVHGVGNPDSKDLLREISND
jgi:hypothetical protein